MVSLVTSRRARVNRRDDGGFTLIEAMISMVLFGILIGVAAGPYSTYRAKQEHVGHARELVAFLRRAQVRAVAEETTYRVDVAADGKSAQAYRFNGSTYVANHVIKVPSARITYATAAFAQESGGSGRSVFFYPRGSASKGSVTVAREGTDKVYTVDVEGLTARVSYE